MRETIALAVLLAATMPAFAQSTPPANKNGKTPAVNAPSNIPNPGAPIAGANSFTESQAKSRIESNGYANVSDLKKDDAGVWRGKAKKAGATVSVSVDFQGNVVAK